MRNLLKITTIICFVFLMASCEKDHENIKIQSITEITDHFKSADDESYYTVAQPTIHGQLVLTLQQLEDGVFLVLKGIDITYESTTTLDNEDCYTFTNVPNGTFKREVYIGGILDHTIIYDVQY